MSDQTVFRHDNLEILVIRLQDQDFCVRTTLVKEIRGWTPVTPLPYAPFELMGITNLRGTVIPIIDLSLKLGMSKSDVSERSAIVVAEVKDLTIGLLVDGVADIISLPSTVLQPVPVAAGVSIAYSDGVIAQDNTITCFLNLERMFEDEGNQWWTKAA